LRVLAVHPDVIVCVSGIWQTTCTIVHGGDETFVIDSPVLPEELEALPSVLDQAGWSLSGLLATHGDWDHVLARTVWPDAALGVAESTGRRLAESPGEPQRKVRKFDEEHYVERPPLPLGSLQTLPVPGRVDVGDRELELHEATGHTVDGMAIVVPWAKVLVCGDYLSPCETPEGHTTDAEAYRATLERLRPLVAAAEWVVPGHGAPLKPERAAEILDDHLALL
jgi:glyoxylase-like metal-dependent hydrolase (beta-lactamase superfamily II)